MHPLLRDCRRGLKLSSRTKDFGRVAEAGQPMQIPVLLDRSRREPLTSQLIEQLRDAIRQARLAAGTRLPSSRQLSEQLSVSRNTVVRAYDALIVEGYVESRPASGVFVSDSGRETPLQPSTNSATGASHMPLPPVAPCVQVLSGHGRGRLTLDFFPRRANAALFPIKTWRRLLQSNLSHGGNLGLAHYGDPAGLPSLRSSIANHLATSRGIAADPSRIIIVSGVQEGVSIAARLFLGRGLLSAIEDPCHQGVAFAFQAMGAEIASVTIDEDGLIPDELPQRPTALLYLTPSHQFPTGHTLSPMRRNDIVAWARRKGCYILEDDCDSDLRYEGSPQQAIAATAPDCTIYLGAFSRTLGAGLRLGYMVVPEQLAGAITAAKGLISNGSPWLEQAALAEMMRTNSYAAHLVRLRAHYKESRDAAGRASPKLRRRQCQRSNRGPACPVAPSARRPGRGDRGEGGVARARRRVFASFRRRLRGVHVGFDPARDNSRLRLAVSQTDRSGYRAPVRRDRRRSR